ncbi:hypothetical protein SPFM15_00162 [Salmonella phage SPFM15]|nr:hypothetical protein SPFM5_00157 [Salmonella phage SPFM5]VFR13786.1 hypothetical protein SPFM15_00162 [Salmonella phage SPFM15]
MCGSLFFWQSIADEIGRRGLTVVHSATLMEMVDRGLPEFVKVGYDKLLTEAKRYLEGCCQVFREEITDAFIAEGYAIALSYARYVDDVTASRLDVAVEELDPGVFMKYNQDMVTTTLFSESLRNSVRQHRTLTF